MERLRKVGFSKLKSYEDAMKDLLSHIKPCPIEKVEVSKAFNRVLAVNIVSEIDVPHFERSAMDGYAIHSEDSFGASPKNPKKLKLIGTIEIGELSDLTVNKGEAIRISTGAALPKGADSVIKIEETNIEGETIFLHISITPGKNVSKKGEDILKGTLALHQGTELKSEHVALLCSLGNDTINVRVKPKASIFATGNELIEVGKPLESNKIYNSNSPMISNLVRQYGGLVIREDTIKDDKNLIRNALLNAIIDSQIVIFTGGTSVGTKDFLPEVIQELGSIITHGIAMRPGSPILIGSLKNSLIFCLPGTPVAAYIGFLTIAGPALKKMLGCTKIDPRNELYATIDKDIPLSSMGYINYLRVKLEKQQNAFIARPVKLKGSSIISSLTQSDGIIEIPPYAEGLKKGESVLVKLFP